MVTMVMIFRLLLCGEDFVVVVVVFSVFIDTINDLFFFYQHFVPISTKHLR